MNTLDIVSFDPADIKAVIAGTSDRRTLRAVCTSQTCGVACWHAKEEVCRCSCGGKNHGCLLVDGAAQPVRAMRIDGAMYELETVDVNPHEIDRRLKSEFAPRAINPETIPQYCDKDTPGFKRGFWDYLSKNSPLRCKVASKEQVAKWPELTAYKDLLSQPWKARPYLLWKLKS